MNDTSLLFSASLPSGMRKWRRKSSNKIYCYWLDFSCIKSKFRI